jgi:hypothetical protein
MSKPIHARNTIFATVARGIPGIPRGFDSEAGLFVVYLFLAAQLMRVVWISGVSDLTTIIPFAYIHCRSEKAPSLSPAAFPQLTAVERVPQAAFRTPTHTQQRYASQQFRRGHLQV